MATKLIGKTLNKQVYRIDLSMVVSKYIGETEKNLAYIFDRSENQDWILFFDEADALFTKRTSVSSSNDKWANLEISYLLQRLEEFTGIAILATNLFANIDTAMRRRFKYIIEFTRPGMMERRKLWQNALPSSFRYSEEIDLDLICREELTGANVGNIIHKSRIKMGQDHKNEVSKSVLYEAIKEELNNENRTPSYIPISH